MTDERDEAVRAWSRRQFLATAGLGGAALAFLAACGSSGGSSAGTTTTAGGTTTTGAGTTTSTSTGTTVPETSGDSMRFLNWPLYIEGDDASTSPTLTGFTEANKIKVDYRPEIDGNDSFFTKYEPLLKAGKGIDADIVVLTSWLCSRMIKAGYVQELNATTFPNKASIVDRLANPTWDPGRKFSIPWATGQTGIAYNKDKVDGPITSIADILNPKYKNRVTLLDEWRDSVGLFMLEMGTSPETGSVADALKAIEMIKQYRDKGQFRKITGNGYAEDLALGDVWIALAWSGDIANLKKDNPSLEFILPPKGAMSFTDNAMIPIKAGNKKGAELLLNYVYDPKVAGPLYESIVYVPPVKGAIEAMTAEGKANTFINPTDLTLLHDFRDLTAAEDEEISRAFVAATQQ